MSIVNLIVVAHPDDEILGFGATGAKLVSLGEKVQPIILSGGVGARTRRPSDENLQKDMLAANKIIGFNDPVLGDFPNIKMNTVPHLEIVQFIEKQIERFQPDRIFTHHPSDLNDDHVQVSKACMVASRIYQRHSNLKPASSLHFMEILSSTEWAYPSNVDLFSPNLFIEVIHFLEKKLEALACYRNVMRDFPHPRSEEAIMGLAAYRGAQSGQNYSEAFQTFFQREL
ncbi:MAG: PIG-L family deacetylase [Lentisphaerales bacterium]|nr:PIG-L family deacetylase [Lentisphaerales bacterium]